jgi:lysyl-tRNA synthetase class 2
MSMTNTTNAVEPTEIEDDPIEVRKAKRQALLDAGEHPYGGRYDYDQHVDELKRRYADLENGASTSDRANVAGRIMAVRNQGKIMFMVLRERMGDIQLFCRINNLGEEAFGKMKDLDVGDWIGARGTIMRTKRGELSIAVDGYTLLSKSIRPLPEKFHGLTDKETRYRQRYVDMVMNPDVKDVFVKRSKIVAACRAYMNSLGFLEVETPILQEIMGGANAKPFITHFNALDQECYLRIATELHLKRCLVGGLDRVYEIGRIFRNEGMDHTHNPEFTTIEAYQAFGDLESMKELAEGFIKCGLHVVSDSEVITYQGQTIDLSGTWRSVPLAQVVSEHLGEHVDIDTPVEHLRALLDANHLEWQDDWGAGKLLFTLYDELCESEIVNPTFVCDYPVEVSPLAKRQEDDPRLTYRFELVIAGHEYANAFSELNDPVDQETRFVAQMEAKRHGDEEAMEYDTDYIRALQYGMPPAGGIGIGIDRMIMLLCDQESIRDVLLFPHMRPERNTNNPNAKGVAAAKAAGDVAEATAEVAAEAELDAKAAGAADAAADAAGDAPDAQWVSTLPAPAEGDVLDAGITREAALDLLKAHNKDEFHIVHGETLEGLMRYYAEKYDPQNVDFWGIVGMLHDLDWEEYPTAEDHTVKTAEMLAEAGVNPLVARCIQTHNSDLRTDLPKPEAHMEKVLYAADELSGLIQACIAVRPSHSVQDFTVKSLKKKFKTKSFAAGCDRDVIAHGAELLDMELPDLFASVIEAMKAIDPDKDSFQAAE